jgi:protein-tyrosine phosphatase
LGFTELHFHLLPGIDDGPRTADESVALAAAAVADGTSTITVTPHIHPAHVTDPLELAEDVARLNDRLRRERHDLRVLPGGELDPRMVQRLDNRRLEAIAHGPAGRRWVLLEAPFTADEALFSSAADELRARGFAVLVGHPERSEPTAPFRAALAREVKCGSAVQLSATAFSGAYGPQAQRTALRLLRSAPRAVIASDAHGRGRPPALSGAVAALALAGVAHPRRFAESRPAALLASGLQRPADALAA